MSINLLSHQRGITGVGRSAGSQQKKEMMVLIGHNTAAAEELTALLERMEHLLDEIDGLKDDLKDLKGQAKDEGFNVAALGRRVAIHRKTGRVDQDNELLNDLLLYAHPTERRSTSHSSTLEGVIIRPDYGASRRDHRPNDDLPSKSVRIS